MEAKINIAEILKDKPVGLKLYSPTFGCISFTGVYKDRVYFYSEDTNAHSVNQYGKMYDGGECIIFPSKEIRDWLKFTWKKGDVLVNKDGTVHIIFEGFEDDKYRTFKGKYYLWEENGHTEQFDTYSYYMQTSVFIKANDDTQTYISTIEERLGGKLNRETLEIEPAQPEFKDGDIVVMDAVSSMCYSKCILILKEDLNTGENSANSYVFYNINNDYIKFNVLTTIRDRNIHLVTEEEKQQLFNALAKEGKAWDSEKKQIINLKPKWTPKPFDRVITRNAADDVWTANIFSHMDSHGEYVTIACVGGYTYCLPYNEETAKLIGTTKDMEDYV